MQQRIYIMEFGQTILKGESVTKSTTVNVEDMTVTVLFATAIPKKQVPPKYMRAVFDFSETGMRRILELAADSATITLQQPYRAGKMALKDIMDCRVAVKDEPQRATKDPEKEVNVNFDKMTDEAKRAWLDARLAEMKSTD